MVLAFRQTISDICIAVFPLRRKTEAFLCISICIYTKKIVHRFVFWSACNEEILLTSKTHQVDYYSQRLRLFRQDSRGPDRWARGPFLLVWVVFLTSLHC